MGWTKITKVPCAPMRGSPRMRALPSSSALAAWMSAASADSAARRRDFRGKPCRDNLAQRLDQLDLAVGRTNSRRDPLRGRSNGSWIRRVSSRYSDAFLIDGVAPRHG